MLSVYKNSSLDFILLRIYNVISCKMQRKSCGCARCILYWEGRGSHERPGRGKAPVRAFARAAGGAVAGDSHRDQPDHTGNLQHGRHLLHRPHRQRRHDHRRDRVHAGVHVPLRDFEPVRRGRGQRDCALAGRGRRGQGPGRRCLLVLGLRGSDAALRAGVTARPASTSPGRWRWAAWPRR